MKLIHLLTIEKQQKKHSYEEQKKLKSLNNKLSKVEAKINALEKEIKEIDVALEVNYDETISEENFFDKYQQKKDDLEQLMMEWEEVQETIDNFS